MVGSDPAAYVQTSDKWMSVIQYSLIYYFFPYVPYVLLVIPWVYFLVNRKKYKKQEKAFLKKTIIFSVAGFVVGLMLPYLILAIWGSLAVWLQYGGTI